MSDVLDYPPDTAEHTSDGGRGPYMGTFMFGRNLIAALSTFQHDILGVATAEEAKARVYFQETLAEPDDELDPSDVEDMADIDDGEPLPEIAETEELFPRPYCILIGDQRTNRRVGTDTWAAEGALFAVFEVPVPAEHLIDHDADDAAVKRDKWLRFVDWRITLASQIEKEITQLSGKNDAAGNPFLNVTDPQLVVEPSDPAEDVAGPPYIAFAFRLPWK